MKRYLLLAVLLLTAPSFAFGLSLQDFLVERVAFDLGDVDARSHDGPGNNVIGALQASGLTDGKFYQLNPITGGTEQLFELVVEVAGNSASNALGYVDSGAGDLQASFVEVITGSASAGATGYVNFNTAPNDAILALNGPDGFFYSLDSLNSGDAHFLALKVIADGLFTFANLGISLNLLAGDVILGLEDKPSRGWDYDYNDMVVVFREVPEPMSMALLGSGLVGLGAMRRRKAAAQK